MTNKLNNLQRNSKAYWSLSKCYLNKKIPLIPPLFHENKFVTNFLEKVEFFNFFFFFKTVFPNKQWEHSPYTYAIFD